jgi:hypothetical protein
MLKYAAATALALITMLTLAVSASVTPANARGANVSAPYCRLGAMVSVRAGTPCVFGTGLDLRWSFAASNQGVTVWKGMVLYSAEIIEPPHNGTAVLRADGRIYYSPKPGFTGRDFMRVQRAACNYSGTWHADPSHDWCGPLVRTYAIFVE